MDEIFTVFFSYNCKDKESVLPVMEALRRQGIGVVEGEAELKTACSGVVFVGPAGLDLHQAQVTHLCLMEGLRRQFPLIPVLLPGGPSRDELPGFLGERTCVDLRTDPTGDPFIGLLCEIRETLVELSPTPLEPLRPFLDPRPRKA
ncbi:MAG TPA: hypothetical protein VKK31_07365 [Thermoanaerobaculia bacterium]|nr:hypothetical protein [Thermoanaerobaculia bacterium]